MKKQKQVMRSVKAHQNNKARAQAQVIQAKTGRAPSSILTMIGATPINRTTKIKGLEIVLPERVALRPRDERGYPILFTTPVIDGKPDFFTIGTAMVAQCHAEGLCGICGQVISHHGDGETDCKPYYFIGGPYSTEVSGVFNDPPMHKDCAEFAMRVCPWMIMHNYKRPKEYVQTPIQVEGTILEDRARPVVLILSKALNYERDQKFWGHLFKAVWIEPVRYWNPKGGGDDYTRAEIDAQILEGWRELFLRMYDGMKAQMMARHAGNTIMAFAKTLMGQVERGEISEEEANRQIRQLTGSEDKQKQ